MRVEIELEIEAGELGREVGIVDHFENLGGDWRRTPQLINQKQFLLGANAAHTSLEPFFLEHPLEGTNVLQEVPEKDPDLLGLSAFDCSRTSCSPIVAFETPFLSGAIVLPVSISAPTALSSRDSPHNAVGAT
jgi:hypothetical protein